MKVEPRNGSVFRVDGRVVRVDGEGVVDREFGDGVLFPPEPCPMADNAPNKTINVMLIPDPRARAIAHLELHYSNDCSKPNSIHYQIKVNFLSRIIASWHLIQQMQRIG